MRDWLSPAVVAATGGTTSDAPAAVFFIFLFNLFYPIGFLGQCFLYGTELAPLSHRVPITAIANATQWLCQFVVAQVTPPGTNNLGSHYYIIYAVLNASFVLIVYFLFPRPMADPWRRWTSSSDNQRVSLMSLRWPANFLGKITSSRGATPKTSLIWYQRRARQPLRRRLNKTYSWRHPWK